MAKRSWKLRTRILGFACGLSFLFLLLIGFTFSFLSSTSNSIARIVDNNLQTERTIEKINSIVLTIRPDIWDTMLFSSSHRNELIEKLNEEALTVYQLLRGLTDLDSKLFPAADRLRALFQAYYQFGSTILQLKSLDEFLALHDVASKFKDNESQLVELLNRTTAMAKEEFYDSMTRLNADFRMMTTTSYYLAALVLVLSLTFALWIAGRLSRPIEQLTAIARQVSAGDYSVRPQVTSGGEILTLSQTFARMLERIQQYTARMEDLIRVRTMELERANATMVKELKFAKRIQEAMIPTFFPSESLSIVGYYLPMEDLGGDFFDVFELSPGVWSLMMADVSGHGVPAALVTAIVKVSLGSHARKVLDPAQVLEAVNHDLVLGLGDARRFVTAIYGVLDTNRNLLEYCSAGHNEFLFLTEDGKLKTYGPTSGVLGFRSDEIYWKRSVPFQQGDTLVFYTDGITEARNAQHESFTLERLQALLQANVNDSLNTLSESIVEAIQGFLGSLSPQDDIAFLAVRRQTQPRSTGVGQRTLIPTESLPGQAEKMFLAGEYEELSEWLRNGLKGISDEREQSALLHWAAMAEFKLGRWTDALLLWQRSLGCDPENRRALRNYRQLVEYFEDGER